MGVPQKVNKEEARALRAQGWKIKDIAARQGCHASRVSLACRGVPSPAGPRDEEARALRAQGWKVEDIAVRQGCHHSQVSRACHGVPSPIEHRCDKGGNLPRANAEKMRISAERRELARSHRLQGLTILQIAAKTGLGRHQVARYCKGLTIRPIGDSAGKNHGRVVPLWVVRADLVDDFRDVLRERGEEAAASHCRRLKAEATRCAA